MNTFLLISAAMLAATLLLLAPSLLRKSKADNRDNREQNIRIARERLAELEQAHSEAELSDEEFAQAKEDLEIALAQDLSQAEQASVSAQQRTGRLTLIALVILVPALTYVMYQETGAPQHLAIVGPGKPAPKVDPNDLPPVEELVVVLEERLNANPENPQGWFLLGRTFMKMQDYDGAVRAFTRLNDVIPNHPQAMLSLADAMSMQNGGRVSEPAMALLRRIIDIEPENPTALWLLGQGAQQAGENGLARAYWERALPLLADNPPMANELRKRLAALDGTPAAPPAGQPVAETGGVLVQVALDPALLDQAPADAVVFIYAKAVSGPPMPLAVSRHRLSELPVQVRLTDSMAMMPQMKLSSFERVLVGARISQSGQAVGQAGDLQSPEVEVASADGEAQLLINQQR